jgi:hypothetical protein
MRTQWFADPADGERLDETLLRLVGAASRMLDGLVRPPVAPGTGRIDAAASAVVLPHAAVPGCSLVVQVAGWSSSVGCWWSVSTDPLAGPANLELATELPLQPDGLTRAVAWLERELQRPVAAGDRRYGLARRLRRHRLARRRRRRPSDALEGRRWSQAEGGHGRQQEPDGQAAEPG